MNRCLMSKTTNHYSNHRIGPNTPPPSEPTYYCNASIWTVHSVSLRSVWQSEVGQKVPVHQTSTVEYTLTTGSDQRGSAAKNDARRVADRVSID